MRVLVVLLVALALDAAFGLEVRMRESLDKGWKGVFKNEDGQVSARRLLSLPHNWDDYHGFRHIFHGNQHGTAAYVRTFRAMPGVGRRTFLVFEGAGSYLTVELNGRILCAHRPAGRIVTTLEATDALRKGENELKVVCEHPSDVMDMPWQCGGCGNCTCESPEPVGLFRSVWLESTGCVRVAPFGLHVWHDNRITRAFAEVELDAGETLPEGVAVRVTCAELGLDEIRRAEAGRIVTFSFPLAKFECWSPDTPKLYTFRADIVDAHGVILDRVETETGFTTVHWPFSGEKDRRFFLNGEPLFVHGASEIDHRFGGSLAFESAEIDARCAEFKKLNMNIFREGHEPHDLRYMHNLERLGILYWTGFSTHFYADTPEFRKNFMMLLEQWVKERRNSPSLAIWGLQNESALPFDFAEACVKRIRELDPLCGADSRPVVTCNYGSGSHWNVIQNWSGTYRGVGGTYLMEYGQDLAKPDQLLNGEYGAWRLAGWHTDPDASWDDKGPWSEEHHARILYEKLMRAWGVRDRVCGQLLWPFFSHENPGRSSSAEEGYRMIDKIGPVNFKGIYTIWGRRVAAWYVYYAYGRHLRAGDLDACMLKPLSWWIAEGRRLAKPMPSKTLEMKAMAGDVYLHRLNCGGDAIVDSAGNKWAADDSRYVSSWSQDADLQVKDYRLNPVLGSQDETEGEVLNVAAADQALLRTFRYGRGRLRFRFPVPTGAVCRVEMLFVEPGSYGRVFDVAVNGRTVERNLDISSCVSDRNALRRMWRVGTGTNATLTIDFPRVSVNQAVVSAIAISTDAESAARMTEETRRAGYPESDGLSWRELTAMCRHKTPKHLLPPDSQENSAPRKIEAILVPDRDGYHWVYFNPYVAGDYTVVFKPAGGRDPVGKEIRWRLQDWELKGTIAEGKFRVPKVWADGTVRLPLKTFINAGGFCFFYQSDGDSVSVREMTSDAP